MAPNTATVIGPAYDGRGNLLADGEMIFVRGRWDQSNGSLIVHGQESVAVEAGNWSIDLVCTDGDRGELISASYIYPDHRSGKPISMSLGVFALPVPGTYPLGGIIGAEDHPPSTQTDALAAALAAAAASASSAASAAASAAAAIEAAAAAEEAAGAGPWQAAANPPIIGVKALLDAAVPVSALPQAVMLEKLRTDYTEWAAYTPMTPDGIDWHRWYHTHRIGNSDAIGSPRLICGARVKLYASTAIAKHAENYVTGTEGQAPTSTQATTAGVATGTWTSPATVSGVTAISYSTAVGDKRVYTVTGAERIAWRAANVAANGGWAKIKVDVSGTEVASGLYDVPLASGTRLVKLNSSALSAGMVYVPLAHGLNPATTYTVTIEVDTTNPASGRVYDGGIRAYDEIAFDAVGIHGTAQEKNLSGVVGNLLFFSGQTVVYEIPDATRIDWNYISTTGSNTAEFTIYDSAGDEIAAYDLSSLATAAAQGGNSAKIASGLTLGTYYLHVRSSSTVTGTDQRIYAAGATAYDTTSPGTVGVDVFDLDGQSRILSSYTTYGQNVFAAFGNQEYATQLRKASEAEGVVDETYFIGGVHNNEGNPLNLVVTVDGSVVDYAGAAQYAQWDGEVIRIEFDQYGLFKIDQSQASLLHWVIEYSAAGYSVAITDTITAVAGAYAHVSYAAMLNAPNGDAGVSVAAGGQLSASLGGGLDSVLMDGWGETVSDVYDGSSTGISARCRGVARHNGAFAIACALLNPAEIDRAFDTVAAKTVSVWSSLNDRTDGTGKSYVRAFSGPASAGTFRAYGHSYTSRKSYRAYQGSGVLRAAGLA